MPNTIDGQYILYVLLIFSFLSDIFLKNRTRLAVPLVVSGRLFGRTRIRRHAVRHGRFGQLPPGSLPFGAYAAGAGLAVPFPGDRDGGIVRYGGIGAEYAQRGGRRNRPGEFCRLFHFVTVTE